MLLNNEEPNELFKYYRLDYLKKDENGENRIVEFNTDGYLDHEPLEFEVGNSRIEINPFVWNNCEIFIDNDLNDWNEFHEWIKKWIAIDDEYAQDENGFSGLIHNVTRPIEENSRITTAIDLGTAPVEALTELLEVFLNDGAVNEIKIASSIGV